MQQIPQHYGNYIIPQHVHTPNYGGFGDNLGTGGKIILYPTLGTIVGIGLAIPTSIILEKALDKAKTKDANLKKLPFVLMLAMPVVGGLLGGFAGVMSALIDKADDDN